MHIQQIVDFLIRTIFRRNEKQQQKSGYFFGSQNKDLLFQAQNKELLA